MDNLAALADAPTTEIRTVLRRLAKAELPTREHLTADEVERLIEAAKRNRYGGSARVSSPEDPPSVAGRQFGPSKKLSRLAVRSASSKSSSRLNILRDTRAKLSSQSMSRVQPGTLAYYPALGLPISPTPRHSTDWLLSIAMGSLFIC